MNENARTDWKGSSSSYLTTEQPSDSNQILYCMLDRMICMQIIMYYCTTHDLVIVAQIAT